MAIKRHKNEGSSEGSGVSGALVEVTSELRAVIEAVSANEVGDDDAIEALALVRELRARLEGERRPRWYDDPAMADEGRTRGSLEFADQSPLRGARNAVAPPLDVVAVTDGDGERTIEARGRLGLTYEGPPHGVHGGFVAAMFDEVLGATQRYTGRPGVTAQLAIKYRHVTPLDEELVFRGWVERDSGRRIVSRATCHAGDTLTAEAHALFVRVDFEEVQARMQARRDEPSR